MSRLIPAPANGGEKQVDDNPTNTNGFLKGSGGLGANPCTGNCGNWTRENDRYWTYDNNNTVDSWARWAAPTSSPSGNTIYEIQVFVPAVNALPADQATWQARYQINHLDGTAYAYIDQSGSRGRWISIGAYRMDPGNPVYLTDATGETGVTRRVGADSVRFIRRGTIYLPDIRYNNGGWSSTLVLRNNGGGLARTVVRWLKSDGSVACNTHVTLVAHRNISLSCSDSLVATAVVDSDQDISAVVRTSNSANTLGRFDNGYRPGTTGDAAFERPATTLYAPAFYRAIFGNMNSTLDIMNVSAQAANVTLEFKGRSGYPDYNSPAYFLTAQGRLHIDATAVPYAPWVGSVKLSSSQPVAASVYESTSGMVRSYNAAAGGNAMIYTSAGYKNVWNLTTGFVVQNLGTTATDITFTFCERLVVNLATCPTQTIYGVAPLRAAGLYMANVAVLPDGWVGSVRITSSGNAPLAAAVNNDLKGAGGVAVDGNDVNATNYGGRLLVLPYAAYNVDGRTTGYVVRNVSGASLTGNAWYYDTDGNLRIGPVPFSLEPAQAFGRSQSNDGLPSGWTGSIVLEATGSIVAILREDAPNRTAAYNGIVLTP